MRFEAQPASGGEHVKLIRTLGSKLPFAKGTQEIISFDDWLSDLPPGSMGAVSRVIEALGNDLSLDDRRPLATADATGVMLNPALVARLTESDASTLGLPPATKLSLELRSSGMIHNSDFRVVARWLRLGGIPASVRIQGARLNEGGKDYRVPEPLYSTLRAVALLNNAATEADRQSALATLRSAMGEVGAGHIAADGVIEGLRLSYASGFSLSLKASASGFDFDPVLFGRERLAEAADGSTLDEVADGLLPPVQAASFARRFRQGDGSRTAYLLDDGAILFVDPQLTLALGVVRSAQRGGTEARRTFARNPERAIAQALRDSGAEAADASALFIETQQFSERVSGIDIWRKPVLPWVTPKPNSWLPEKFGLRIGDPPDARTVEIAAEELPAAAEAVAAAVREERATFTFNGEEIPATQQSQSAIESLAELFKEATEAESGKAPEPGPDVRERYFLQINDNLEDVSYAPLARVPRPEFPPPEMPGTVVSRPKPHQDAGFAWLVACWRAGIPGAMLADDMGLGKTFQALAFLAWLRATEPAKPVLIVAPTGLLANWRGEIERHLAPGALGPIINAYGGSLARMRDGPGRDIELGSSRVDIDDWGSAGVILTTFETMRDYHLSFARQPFGVIIYDEAQKLKNPASQMTRAAKTLNARFQIAMTGTPVENRLQDLWSIFDVVHPGLLGSSKAFEADYPADSQERLKALHDLLTIKTDDRPAVLLRRMKDDCLPGLPVKRVEKFPVAMPPKQAAAYDRIIQRAMVVKGSGQRGRMLEILQHLRGVSLHPFAPEEADGDDAYFDDSARMATLFSLLERIAKVGEKVLIFCESLAMQALLATEIRWRFALPHPVIRIHGGVTGDARQAAVDLFQGRPRGFDAMLLSPKAGGVGLTLTAANHVIHLSRWWNPAVEDQATDRAYRIGQTRDVTVYLPQSVHPDPTIRPSSFDLKLDQLMERKRMLSRGLLMPGDDDSDAGALFDAVVQTAEELTLEPNAPEPEAEAEPVARPTLTPRPVAPRAPPEKRWPSRVEYPAHGARDFAIFTGPIAGARIDALDIVDPYACVDERTRACLVEFVAMLAAAAQATAAVSLISWDADSVELHVAESSAHQRFDLGQRWKARFGERPTLKHDQWSKRQRRDLHDRHVTATFADGRRLVWDLGRGVEGVMNSRRDCRVNLSEA